MPKQYLPVAGRPMIVHTLIAFAAVPAIERIVVVVAPDDRWFEHLSLPLDVDARVDVVRVGGATRDASVAQGLAAMRTSTEPDDWILVHDAARCGITAPAIASLIDRLRHDPVGGLLALPMDDTVKRQRPDDAESAPTVEATVDRRTLWRAQTPQMFRYRLLADAIDAARTSGAVTTDESSAMEAAGHRVALVSGSARNFKVTSADDLAMMASLLAPASSAREDCAMDPNPSPLAR